jgi:hypothetical protein
MNVEVNRRFLTFTINWLNSIAWYKISMRKTFMLHFYRKDLRQLLIKKWAMMVSIWHSGFKKNFHLVNLQDQLLKINMGVWCLNIFQHYPKISWKFMKWILQLIFILNKVWCNREATFWQYQNLIKHIG